MDLLTASQMRTIEQTAIDSGEVTGLELMEHAGKGVVDAIYEWRPELEECDRRAMVFCGPGNNGGDGFVVARLLKEKGWTVDVFLYGDEAKLPPDAAENARRWREVGEIGSLPTEDMDRFQSYDLFIDALFGTGLTRPLEGAAAKLAGMMRQSQGIRRYRIAIDTPSGICMDSGRAIGPAFSADLTVTFHTRKVGHFLGAETESFGHLVCKDIGLEAPAPPDALNCIERTDFPDKHSWGHKYSHGHALIVSGGMARTGAARLAARGAIRAGAGLVTIASPPDALMENAAHLTAIMLRKMNGADGLRDILSDERINAVVIGPGCGIGEKTRELVSVALEGARTVILDADALTSFAESPELLFHQIKTSASETILTPHGGEFARLFPDLAEHLAEPPTKGPAYSKLDASRDAAKRSGATVLYKGPDTLIAHPDGRASIAAAVYERETPWLATAGSGDVLAGMIAGLAAQTTPDPTGNAAWLHQECGRVLGPGMIAEDIPEAIPGMLKKLLEWSPPR